MAWRSVSLTEFITTTAGWVAAGATFTREIGQPVPEQPNNRRIVNDRGEPQAHHGAGSDWYEVTVRIPGPPVVVTHAKVEGLFSGPPGLFVWDAP